MKIRNKALFVVGLILAIVAPPGSDGRVNRGPRTLYS